MQHQPQRLTADDVGKKFEALDLDGLPNPEFLPSPAFRDLISPGTVKATISSHFADPNEVESLVRYSLENQRVFLTCVISKFVPYIKSFSRAGFSDGSLPVQAMPHENGPLICSTHQAKAWGCFRQDGDHWDWEEKRRFLGYQWNFSAVTFNCDAFFLSLAPECPLPYVKLDEESTGNGGFGKVYRVGLLKEHLTCTSPRYLSLSSYPPSSQSPIGTYEAYDVAVKQLQVKDADNDEMEKFFKKEKNTLHTMRELNHRHLIQAIVAYEKGSRNPEKYFVFPWATGGDLRSFWWNEGHLKNNQEFTYWALNQIKGLVDGVAKLHEKKTRHGDIKPRNILVFPGDGEKQRILVIADVGVAKFHAEETRERWLQSYETTHKYATRKYEAPEIRVLPVGQDKRIIPRKADVWSMGCVLLEFVTWLLLGRKGHSDFVEELDNDKRGDRFWYLDNSKPCIHPVVQDWIEKLHRDAGDNTVLTDLLELIQHRMLVVSAPVESDADPNEQRADPNQHRAEAKAVYRKLCENEKKSPNDPSYPWNWTSTILTDGREPMTTAAVSDDFLALSQEVGLHLS